MACRNLFSRADVVAPVGIRASLNLISTIGIIASRRGLYLRHDWTPFRSLVSCARRQIGMSEASKCAHISKTFMESYKSPLSLILIDDIERIIDYVQIGPRFRYINCPYLQCCRWVVLYYSSTIQYSIYTTSTSTRVLLVVRDKALLVVLRSNTCRTWRSRRSVILGLVHA